MPEDFGYAWRTVRLYCPSAPTFLAREWVQTAWKQLLSARRWAFMRGQTTLAFDGTSPYAILPADFGSFDVVVDQTRRVRLCTGHTVDELACKDPSLSATGPPALLLPAGPSTDPLTRGQLQVRGYPLGSATLTAVYHRQGPRLTDTDVFTGVLADGAEVLVAGALAQAALWPGTADKANPYFNASLAQTKTLEFKTGMQMLSLRDDEQYPTDLWDSYAQADCGCAASGDCRQTDASAACC